MDRKWVFPEETSEDPNAGSPWSALNEIELDVHSSKRSEPESIHYFVTGFFLTIKKYLAHCSTSEHVKVLIILILFTAAEYLIFLASSMLMNI